MKLITKQGIVQLKEGEIITITTDDDYPIVELEIAGALIQVSIHDPHHVESEVLI